MASMFRQALLFIRDTYAKRGLLYELAKRDLQKQYTGSSLGFVWIYLQPLLFIGVLYIVFSIGLRNAPAKEGTPFALYLVSGIVAWFYMAETLNAGTQVIKQHSFLLKKVDFRLSILPLVKLASASVPHIFFVLLALLLATFKGYFPGWHTWQLFYYFTAMVLLLLGITWITSATNLFLSDISKLISLIVTFGFWMTPIFWDIDNIPEHYRWIAHLNPATYIVEGYRDAVYRGVFFWEKPWQTLYFWSVTIGALWSGITIFRKLRPHFAEVA